MVPDHVSQASSPGMVDLLGGLEHGVYDFPHNGNFIIPTDELIFFRGVGQPPTSDSTSSPVKSGGSDGQVPVLRQWMHQSAQPPKVGFDMEDGCYGSNLGIIL